MKKTIVMTIVFVMVLLSFANIVNADATKTATVSIAGNSEVKTGDTVTVTVSIKSEEDVLGAHMLVNYDPSFLEYVDCSAMAANGKTAGVVDLEDVKTSGVKKVDLTFKVVGTEGTTEVKATPVEFTAGTTEEDIMNVGTVEGTWKVTIVKEEVPVTPTEPSVTDPETTKPADTTPAEKPATTAPATTTPSTSAQQPTKYPKTGFNVAPMLIAGLAISLVAVIVRFRKNSK